MAERPALGADARGRPLTIKYVAREEFFQKKKIFWRATEATRIAKQFGWQIACGLNFLHLKLGNFFEVLGVSGEESGAGVKRRRGDDGVGEFN